MFLRQFLGSFLTTIAMFTALSFDAPSAHAKQELSGMEIKSLITWKRIFLKVPLGGEFPLRYRRNEMVSGDGSAMGLGKYMPQKKLVVGGCKTTSSANSGSLGTRGRSLVFSFLKLVRINYIGSEMMGDRARHVLQTEDMDFISSVANY